MQGLLELLWTVYSEEILKSCLKLRNFQNPLKRISRRSIRNTEYKKGLKFPPVLELAKLKFTYITAGPGFD